MYGTNFSTLEYSHRPDFRCRDHPLASLIAVDTPSKEFIPLSSIQPFPKATIQNRRRKGKKSIVATDNPFKSELEQKNQKYEGKIAKKETTFRIETRESLLRLVKKKIESKENDYSCVLCGERYVDPPTEDWIQCSSCNSWWHEQCTSYENGIFRLKD
ncbi:hypothetical protein PV325_005010, partial [Microctonus aethiopoides]